MAPKEVEQGIALKEIFITGEIFEEVDQSQDECKKVGHNLFEVLPPPMEDIPHHGMVIHHDFEDLFLRKKSANDDSSKFFEFISFTISTWMQHVL